MTLMTQSRLRDGAKPTLIFINFRLLRGW